MPRPLWCLDCGRSINPERVDHWCSKRCERAWRRRLLEDPAMVERLSRVIPRVREETNGD